jgi:2-polyprenyl-6-methoxyphenol hydroxylase-like FAD-dependent oxidoreductase
VQSEVRFTERKFIPGVLMDAQVLIAGAGPTGLTLAIELARRGIDVRVVDKAECFARGSRGDGLQPRTLEVFEDLGVLDEVFAAGIGAPLMRIYEGDTVVWEDRMPKLEPPRPDRPYPNLWFVPQWRTEEILRSALSRYGTKVQLDAEVVGVEQDERDDGAVTVHLRGGETVRACYVVGADGGRSAVRRQLAVPFLGTADDEVRMVLADVCADGLDHDCGHGWMLNGHDFFGFTPLAGGTDTFVLATAAPEVEPTLEGLQATVDAASGRPDIRLRELTWSTIWRPNVRLAQRFRVGRVFLAGDSAHVHPPTGGKGSTPACRTPTTSAGSWPRCSRGLADRLRTLKPCSTVTRKSECRLPPECSGSAPSCWTDFCAVATTRGNAARKRDNSI